MGFVAVYFAYAYYLTMKEDKQELSNQRLEQLLQIDNSPAFKYGYEIGTDIVSDLGEFGDYEFACSQYSGDIYSGCQAAIDVERGN